MTQTLLYYRLRVRNAADDSDVIVLSSKTGVANALLCEPPEGDGQTIDPIMGTLEVGAYTWQAIDRYEGGDTYTITSLIADADARNQLLSNKCIGEYSTDGSTWNPLHTGYLNDLKLSDAATYTLIVGDTDRRERDAVLFKTITETFDRVSNIIGGPVEADSPVAYQGTPTRAWGPIIDYGPARFQVIANPSGLVTPTNRVTLSLVGANLPPRYLGFQGVFNGKIPNPAEYIDQFAYQYFEDDVEGLYKTDGTQQSQPWGSFPQLEVKLRRVSDAAIFRTFPIAQAAKKASALPIPPATPPDYPIGDYKALVANSNDWLIVAWDTATMGSQPSVGTQFDAWVRPIVISEENPLHLRGHPVDLHIAANDDQGIAYDATSAAATKTALGDLFYELRIEPKSGDGIPYADFTEMLKSSAGYAVRYNADNEQEFFPTRATQPAAVATVTTADLIGDDRGEPQDPIFRVSESSAVKGVDVKLKQFRLWNVNTDDPSDRPIDGVIAEDLTINGKRRDESVYGSKIITFEVPGMIMLSGGSALLNQPLALRDWIIAAGEVIIDRAGWGWQEGELEVLATVAGKVGEYLDLEAPHQVNAKVGQSPVGQRGGTRKVQIVARTELPGTSKLKVKDAGNIAQDPPSAPDDGGTAVDPNDGLPVPELSLAESADNPTTIATVTLDNITDFDDLNADTELQYLVQEATPASTDSGDNFGPLESSTGDDEIDAPAVLAGELLWVRGRATIQSAQLFGAWSDWISLRLGPDDDGSGGTLSPFDLELAVDGDGVLSAAATSLVAAITKVYFVAGDDTGSTPSYADVLAGTADASGPPFTAATLATMTVGETRTVGAIGEDALGNRTTLVLATKTRISSGDIDPGNSSGTPGNQLLTWHTTPAVVVRNVGPDLFEPEAAIASRRYLNTAAVGAMRPQLANWLASGDVELHFIYSLDAGATWNEAGPFAELNAPKFPAVGEYLPLNEGAVGTNILFSWGLKGGSGTDVVRVGNIYSDSVSSDEPPDSPSDDTDAPQGGPLGNVLLDLNAFTLLELETVEDAELTTWPDDSGNGNDAIAHLLSGSTKPIFKAAGIGGGKPCVRFRGSSDSMRFPIPSQTEFTIYFVFDNIAKSGSVGSGAYPNGSALIQNSVGSSSASFGVAMKLNGKINYGVGENAVVSTTASRDTVNSWDDSAKHVHAFVRQPTGGLAAYYVDGDDESTSGINTTGAAMTAEPYVYIAVKPFIGYPSALDAGRILWYDQAHGPSEIAIVTDFLRDQWGTP